MKNRRRTLFDCIAPLIGASAIVCIAQLVAACGIWKPIAKTVLDMTVATCLEEHPEIQSEPAAREFCKYAPDVAPLVDEFLSARKRGAKRMASMQSDGGASDASPDH